MNGIAGKYLSGRNRASARHNKVVGNMNESGYHSLVKTTLFGDKDVSACCRFYRKLLHGKDNGLIYISCWTFAQNTAVTIKIAVY